MALPQEKTSYTYADYLAWDKHERIELMEGVPIMQVAPSRIHQEISAELMRQLTNFLEGKQCKAYAAPFSVRLFEEDADTPEDVQTVFEPDITVVCDQSKLDEHGCKGAPDLVMEILSPSTAKHDLFFKMTRYRQAGVKEYWTVSPGEKTVQVFTLVDGKFEIHEVYSASDIAKVNVLRGCFIELSKVFAE